MPRGYGDTILTMHFEESPAGGGAGEVSETGKTLFSGTRPAMGDSLRSLWRCEVVQDGDRLIADFHEQGALLIDGSRNLVEGYFVRPDAMHPMCA